MATIVLALVAGGCAREVDLAPPTPSADPAGPRAEAARRTLAALETALGEGSRRDAVDLAASPSRELLAGVHDNAEALRVEELSLRYVDEGAAPSAGQRAAFGEDAWVGTVDLTYAYAGFDEDPARVETEMVFVPDGDRALIAAIGGAEVRTPLWLVERLAVVRTRRTLVLVAATSAGRYPGLVSRAVTRVGRLLTAWRGSLVVEVPESRTRLEESLQATPGQYAGIAAVTTTADGSLAPGAPVRIEVNPEVFGKLRLRGAQVVMTHEATHAAAEAPFASMPTWLLEGFADYVALDGAGVPVSVAAAQILRRIREQGLPRGLPSSADLDPTAPGLGATYEEAWLACRYLAQKYGATEMLAFYRAADTGASTRAAFRSVLGTTQGEFVAGWRRDLARLAGVPAPTTP